MCETNFSKITSVPTLGESLILLLSGNILVVDGSDDDEGDDNSDGEF
jgi:hypothetical protein